MAASAYYHKKRRKRHTMTRKKKINPLLIIIPAVVVVAAVLLIVLLSPKKEPEQNIRYLASSSARVPYYYVNDEEHRLIRSSQMLQRGTPVNDLKKSYTENGIEYAVIEYNGENYYISSSSMVDDPQDVIQETEVWVRTSATVYENESGPEIASFAKKGTRLSVQGYDEIQEDGSIHKYLVNFTDVTGKNVTGWVYGKYMAATEKEALQVNTEIYEIHKNRVYSGRDLHGGSPTSLDWYPVEKPIFPDNPICDYCSGMYITSKALDHIDDYIEIAKANGVNCMVINIKGETGMSYPVEEIKEISPTSYKLIYFPTAESFQKAVKKCQDAGLYCIGRIIMFNDSVYALDHPEECIESSSANQLWPSAYSRNCWYFNLLLATAAVKLCGFNEIQFDYVRFPEEAYSMSESGDTDFKNVYDEEKDEVIQNFCYYAADVLHELGVYMSVDVFGECASPYITAYGQYYPAISLVVDAISAMPYTDHYGREVDTWTDAYATLYDWGLKAAERQSEIPTPAIARTWVTCYDVPYWNPTVTCDAGYIADQAQALADAGLSGGFMTWNGVSNLEKYKVIADAWDTVYTQQTPRIQKY